jgi:hypothetical protein
MDGAQHLGDEQIIQQIIAAEQAWLHAHLQGDVVMLENLMAAEYLQITDSGGICTKAEVLASFQADTRHWTHASSDDYRIRIYGQTAVVVGRWQAAGVNNGQAFDYASRYISMWVWRDNRWQIVSDQSTTISN